MARGFHARSGAQPGELLVDQRGESSIQIEVLAVLVKLNFCTEDAADHQFGAGLCIAVVAKRASLLTGADQVLQKAAEAPQHGFELLR